MFLGKLRAQPEFQALIRAVRSLPYLGRYADSAIARFKAVARKNFTDAPDFDGEWNLGYKEAQSTVDRFAALKTSNPQEYAQKIGEACPALARGIDESTAGQ